MDEAEVGCGLGLSHYELTMSVPGRIADTDQREKSRDYPVQPWILSSGAKAKQWIHVDEIKLARMLNRKQSMVLQAIGEIMIEGVTAKGPLLMYVGGEGGTGKTRVIQAITELAKRLEVVDSMVLCAPTGTAANNINGQTIHSVLNLSFSSRGGGDRNKWKVERHARYWAGKRYLIIDEISMVDLAELDEIHERLVMLKQSSTDQPSPFGGLDAVMLFGDFCQLPPVLYGNKGPKPLWWAPRPDNPAELNGKQLWNRFSAVVLLTEQMRQSQDKQYHALVQRARSGTLTRSDEDMLLSRVMTRRTTNYAVSDFPRN